MLNVKKLRRTTNGAMLHSFTNCSPFKTVACLFFAKFIHERKNVDEITTAFVSGEANMANFLQEYLPRRGSSITQLALYLQGLYRMKAKYRQDIRFENPRAIVDEIVAERLQQYQVQRLREQRMQDRKINRLEIRLPDAYIFLQYHHANRELNKHCPGDDQLELMRQACYRVTALTGIVPIFLSTFKLKSIRNRERGIDL
jgi:hypothetical protein